MRSPLALALLLSATTLTAAPVITSISPTSGPVTGGTTVTISGTGFSNVCPPMSGCTTGPIVVWFGTTQGSNAQLVDANTITVMTPAHLPETASVTLVQPDGSASAPAQFTFTGNATEAFDRILLPIFLPPIYGAYGSQFVTNLSLWNSTAQNMTVYGLTMPCSTVPCVPGIVLPSRPANVNTGFLPSGTAAAPGTFIYVPKSTGQFLNSTLRVQDVSRQAQTWGTSIPVVHDSGFVQHPIALLDIPNDDRFRNTLRVYGDGSGTVFVRIAQTAPAATTLAEFMLPLSTPVSIFDPPYASFSAFPAPPITTGPAVSTLRIEIEPATYLLRIWAFDSVTNNDTQHITVITPQ